MNRKPLIGVTPDIKEGAITLRNRYLQSVTDAGGIPIVLPLSVSWDDVSWLLGRVDGFLIMGGPTSTRRFTGKRSRLSAEK